MTVTARSIREWSEMIKLQHSVFALPFAIIAAFFAGREIEGVRRPYGGQLLLLIVCMVGARSVAMTFNRIVDAEIDSRNPRTAQRALPADRLSRRAAWLFLGGSALAYLMGCAGFQWLYQNPWPLRLSLPVLVYLCAYSYSKRFTRWSHFYLGSAIALSPAAAWVAVHPQSIGWSAIVLSAAVALWIAGFDIIYACQDIEVDRREKLHSLPSRIGPRGALLVARGCHLCVVALLASLIPLASLGWLYGAGVIMVGFLLAIENRLVQPNDFSRINLAFFTINGIVGVSLAVLAVLDVLLVSNGS